MDLSQDNSLDTIQEFLSQAKQTGKKDTLFFLIGTKKDIRVLKTDIVREKAQSLNLIYHETSSKKNEGIDELETDLIKRLT